MKPIQQTDSPEEMLDLVDDGDRVIGQISRSDAVVQGLHNYRVVNAFIRNKEGMLWIPRRAMTKKSFPDALDFSIGGHVTAGETYEQALLKEAAEEVNLDLDLSLVPYTELAYLNPAKQPVAVWQKIYEIQLDEVPNYNPEDFSSYEWLRPSEVIERAEAGEAMKGDLPVVVKLCYLS